MNAIPAKRTQLLLATLIAGVALALLAPARGQTAADRDQAEQWFAEGSFAKAHEAYERLAGAELPTADARWIAFRLADTLWRSEAATSTADDTQLEQARRELEAIVAAASRDEQRDRVWAEAQESLGDFWWTREGANNWGQAWQHYGSALGWWAASREIELARTRWIAIVRRAAHPPQAPPYYSYGYYGNQLPLAIVENARTIAVDADDRAYAAYLLAMTLRQQAGSPAGVRRAREAFEAAVEEGRGSAWHDDALYQYAEWLTGSGRVVKQTGQAERVAPDFVRAVELFRELQRIYTKGETRWYDPATEQIARITRPTLDVGVSNVFLPGSEVRFYLGWRNVKEVRFSLHPVQLTADLKFASERGDVSSWLDRFNLTESSALRSWTRPTGDRGDHEPGQEEIVLEPKLALGAYVLEARSAGERVRELILVTGTAIVLEASDERALAWVVDAVDGSPRVGADVALWVGHYVSGSVDWRRLAARSDEQGIASFELPGSEQNVQLFAAAVHGDDQAIGIGQSWNRQHGRDAWKLYVFTDRPAYRPEDTVQWKLVARRVADGVYTTPSDAALEYRIVDPRGTELAKGTLELNAFGSAWSELELGATLPLGEYAVQFTDPRDDDRSIGAATLFRLEEYKLPEFSVTVETPRDDDGVPRTFRSGETVEAEVVAQYYFGGPVADAEVELLIRQRPLHVFWPRPRPYPWLYDDQTPHWGRWYGPGQIVERRNVRTDASGRALVRFDTPQSSGQDFEFTFEARVVDASRREVAGSGVLRVTRQRYFAFLDAEHRIYRPGDRVALDLRTADANENPISEQGTVRVTRERWVEVWLDPAGREVRGKALEKLRAAKSAFPPPPASPDVPGWRLKFRGYETEPVLERLVRTADDGTARFEFQADSIGYYRITWSGDDESTWPVRAESAVWVTDRETNDLGYHLDGVQILVDRDTVHAGGTTPVMLATDTPDSWVLFSVKAEELIEWRVVHVAGTVKLVELQIDERHVPNVFLEAARVRDGRLAVDQQQLVVPPVEHYLDVAVEADRDAYRPGETAELRVTTRDHAGRPIATEVALAFVDASIFAIQQDYSGDPRPFFFGEKRSNLVQLFSTFQYKSYTTLRLDEGGTWVDWAQRRDADLYGEERLEGSSSAADGVSAQAGVRGSEIGNARLSSAKVEMDMMSQPQPEAAPPSAEGGFVPGEGDGSAVQVRSDFRATALWEPALVTDSSGTATVRVKLPDSLTAWKATARAATAGNAFGIAESETRTRKPLIVRLQAPRFFVAGDEVVISAVINNNSEEELDTRATLRVEGVELLDAAGETVSVAAGREARVDWRVAVRQAGAVRLAVEARGGDESDGMEKSYVAHEHGIDKLLVRAGKVRGDDVRVTLDLPSARRAGSSTMTVQVTPSLAVTMLDALPYLIDYPYGCTEQTMSRFLPLTVVARALAQLGLDRADVADRVFGGIEREHVDATQPSGERRLAELDDMARRGLERLYDFQHGDGGWGWWKEGDSDPFMTAYVVWGLALAEDADVKVDRTALQRGVSYLDRELVEYEAVPDVQAWMLHALAVAGRGEQTKFQRTAFDNLWLGRDRLNAYGRSLLALAAHAYGDAERARTLVRNLENGVKRDRTPDTSVVVAAIKGGGDEVVGTAHWGSDGLWWHWSEGPVETTAFALRALLAIDPQHELIEPVTNWLIKNRRGAQWSNTRDTAIAVLAMTDYLKTSGELNATLEYEITVNEKPLAKRSVTPADVLAAPSRFVVDPALLRDGKNEVRIRRTAGSGPLYFAAEARFFSLEEPVTAAGNEIFVRRHYFKRVGYPTLLAGYRYENRPLEDQGTVVSGERAEVVVTIESKNDYEYLIFEDLKPAGLEAVELRSGEPLYVREIKSSAVLRPDGTREPQDYTGRTRAVYRELRDRKVALFVDKLPQGVWEVRYELRAEVPGSFHALPLVGHAMYVPEIRANSEELRLRVEDR